MKEHSLHRNKTAGLDIYIGNNQIKRPEDDGID
jgi:hypothetical protein